MEREAVKIILAVLLATALALLPCRARAEANTSALSWVRLPGSESCITTPELGARVEKHLGRPVLVSPSVADVSIEGRVEAVGTGPARKYRAVVGGTRRDGTLIGTREMTSPGTDCRALDAGLVLVVALMIDPDALSPARPEPPPPGPPPPEVTREIIHERVVHEVERVDVPARPWLVQASISGAAAIQRVPGVAPGSTLALRAGPSALVAFQASLGVVLGGELTVGSRAVDYSLLEGGLAYCPAVPMGRRVDAGGCAGVRVGAVRSQGRGFAADREVDRGFADVALGPRVEVTLAGPLFAVASASALVHLVRHETTLTDAAGKSVVADARSILGAELGIGLGVRFSP
jgi:hypothetical protein